MNAHAAISCRGDLMAALPEPVPASTETEAAKARLLSIRGEPLLLSDWARALFIHFEVEAEALQPEVPFLLDRREGKAYVSLVAFTMERMRLRVGGGWTSWWTKPIATHPLLNLRTYVRHGGEAGIYFMAEWVPNRLSAFLGPRTFGLPYRLGRLAYTNRHEEGIWQGRVECLSDASKEPVGVRPTEGSNAPRVLRYEAWPVSRTSPEPPREGTRHSGRSGLRLAPCAPGSLDGWLLERYTAFTQQNCSARFFRVWHPAWPQMPMGVALTDDSLLRDRPWFKTAKLAGANYSPGVQDVWMGRAHRLAKEGRHSVLSAFYELP